MVQVDPSEDLTKFIFNRSQFSPSNNRVKYSAFMPPPNRRLSVFRIAGFAENDVWEIGETIGERRTLPLSARADIKVLFVAETGLKIDADDIPPRHVNIIDWPEDHSAVILKAKELARKAQLHLR